MLEMQCIVSGKVQGVSYRTHVQDSAGALGLTGYVRNLSDGQVEVVAQGDQTTLKEFVEYLHEGSLLSEVEGVAVEWRSLKNKLDDFSILYS